MADTHTIVIEAQPRDIAGKKVRSLRQQELVPAVLYGNGIESQSLTLDRGLFDKAYRQAGESTIVKVKMGDKTPVNALIHDVQRHPSRGDVMHVDFYQVRMDEKLTATVQLTFVGEAPAVKALGGTLTYPVSEVEVESLPADLPHGIEVDVSVLATFEDVIRISDLKLDRSKVEVMADPEQVVALVQEPRSEEEMAELDAPTGDGIENVEGLVKEDDKSSTEGAKAQEPAA